MLASPSKLIDPPSRPKHTHIQLPPLPSPPQTHLSSQLHAYSELRLGCSAELAEHLLGREIGREIHQTAAVGGQLVVQRLDRLTGQLCMRVRVRGGTRLEAGGYRVRLRVRVEAEPGVRVQRFPPASAPASKSDLIVSSIT